MISGDLWQLPPIYDNLVTDNNHLDGRPEFSPSHWDDNFKIFYMNAVLVKLCKNPKPQLLQNVMDKSFHQ